MLLPMKESTRVLPDPDTMYEALIERDSRYDGIFFFAVKTTGVFCRPVCTARKPLRKNVEFFATAEEALLHGYRPCKVCSPMGKNGDAPPWLKPLLRELEDNPELRIKNYNLRELGLDPARVRRWFRKNHGMTFQAYQRALRIGQAFGRIRYGEKVIDTAFESGYESLSGFADSFKKTTGFSPSGSRKKNLIVVTRIPTPLGPMLAGATDRGICLLEFVDRRMLETQLGRIRSRFDAELLPGVSTHFDTLNIQLEEYFEGKRRAFSVPLDFAGTPFQEKVWKALLEIPYGETRSYKDQAKAIGNPRAVRAVARANGDNRIALFIPCHRVIGSDGTLVGYGGGLWRKRYLLELEGVKLS